MCYLRGPGPGASVQSCSMHRSGRMGSILGSSRVSLEVLLGDWPLLGEGPRLGEGPLEPWPWKDSLKRDVPEKEGAAMPGV